MDCTTCKELKLMNRPRPTCEECGLPAHIMPQTSQVWRLYNKWFHCIVSMNGMGGWSINPEFVSKLAAKERLDEFILLERMQLVASVLFTRKKEEET